MWLVPHCPLPGPADELPETLRLVLWTSSIEGIATNERQTLH